MFYQQMRIPDVQRLSGNENRSWLIQNVNVLPMDNPEQPVLYAHSVVVENGMITQIFPNADINNLPNLSSLDIIDGQGMYLTPGLTDVHVHVLDEAELAAFLYYGVTAIRNMNGFSMHLRMQASIENAQLLGPSFITTGQILNSPGSNFNGFQQSVQTPEQAIAAVEKQYQQGFRHLKVYSNLFPDVFDAIKQSAQALGMSITGHSPEGHRHDGVPYEKPFEISWDESVGQGFTSLEHIETIAWHALRDTMNETSMRAAAQQLATSGDAVTPTLIAHRRLVKVAQSKGGYLHQEDSDMINPVIPIMEIGAQEFWSNMDPNGYELPHAMFFLEATKMLQQENVPLLAGSDAGGFGLIPGKSLHEELALMSEAGLSNYQVLQAATKNASLIGFTKLGQIKPEFTANLLLLKQNPLEDLQNLSQIEGVMVNGHWIDSGEREELKQVAKDTRLTRSLVRIAEIRISEWF